MIKFGFVGMVFNNFVTLPDLWVWFCAKLHSLVNFSGMSGFMSMLFRICSGFMGMLSRHLTGFICGTSTI